MRDSLYLFGLTVGLVAIMAIGGGCATIPDAGTEALADYAKARLQEYGVTLSQAEIDEAIAKAQPEIDKLVEAFPALMPIMPELIKMSTLIASGMTNLTYVSPTGSLYAGFLMDDANIRVMNKLSINANAKDRTALLKAQKQHGFNQVLFFLANEGDGGPVPTTFYRDAWFGDVDPAKVSMMRAAITEWKAAGFAVELWGIADDSPSLSRATPEQLQCFYELCVTHFGDLADSWCVGLEINEWGERWWNTLWHKADIKLIQGAVNVLKATGKPVAVHMTSYKDIDLAHQSGADTFNAQFGWFSRVSEMTDAMAWINARKGNMRIVATEFNRDSTTPLATALATEAMRCGAAGTQTGRLRE